MQGKSPTHCTIDPVPEQKDIKPEIPLRYSVSLKKSILVFQFGVWVLGDVQLLLVVLWETGIGTQDQTQVLIQTKHVLYF